MERNLRKERVGIVVSDSMDKSVVVKVEVREKHPMYGKFVKKTKKFVAHDEKQESHTGDTVKIMETKVSNVTFSFTCTFCTGRCVIICASYV